MSLRTGRASVQEALAKVKRPSPKQVAFAVAFAVEWALAFAVAKALANAVTDADVQELRDRVRHLEWNHDVTWSERDKCYYRIETGTNAPSDGNDHTTGERDVLFPS